MGIGDVVKTVRADRYHVEIRHPGGDWNHIHPPAWETTADPNAARTYASHVRADHPDSEVQIMQTRTVEVTKLFTGETTTVNLDR